MKFKIKNKLLVPSNYKIHKGSIYFLIEGKITKSDLNFGNFMGINFSDEIDSFFIKFNNIYIKSNSYLFKIQSNEKVIKCLPYSGENFSPIDSNSYLIYKYVDEDNYYNSEKIVRYIANEELIWKYRSLNPIILINSNILIQKDKTEAKTMNRLELKNQTLIWTYHLPPPMHTYGRFYLVDQVLIFRTNTAHLIGLDIETGKELWRLEKCMPSFQVMEEQKKLIGLQTDLYQVIDPINGEKVIEKRFENLKEKYRIWPSSHLANVYPEGLYFVSNYQGTRFGMVDIYNSEIAWIQDHNPEAGRYEGLAAPVLHQDKLYLHEAGKTLYVYERV